jgi:hypothetical protein
VQREEEKEVEKRKRKRWRKGIERGGEKEEEVAVTSWNRNSLRCIVRKSWSRRHEKKIEKRSVASSVCAVRKYGE